MDNKFDNTQAVNYYDYRGTNNPKCPPVVRRKPQIKYWVIRIIIGITLLSTGYGIGQINNRIQLDGKDISVSKKGVIHYRGCFYFRAGQADFCEYCEMLKNK